MTMSHAPGSEARAVARWRYEAADARGVTTTGEIDAASEREAIDTLRRRALWATRLVAVGGERPGRATSADADVVLDGDASLRLRATPAWRERLAALAGRSSAMELGVILRAMGTLLAAGVTLDRALTYATGSTTPRLQQAFRALQSRVRGGEALSAAIGAEPLFPRVFAPTIAAAEASGTLDEAFVLLADHVERAEAVKARLRAALVYPAVLGVASVVGVTVMLLVVVPRFGALIANTDDTLPLSTRVLVGASSLFTAAWWAILPLLALAMLAWRGWKRSPANRRRWHDARLGWPVVGPLERTRAGAAYSGTLAIALRAGVALLPAMRLARESVANEALAARLAVAEERVRTGGALAASVDGVLPPLAVRLLDAGEAGGNLADMARRASEAADAEAQRAIGTAVALVEPALILGFGGIVGFVALALLQAIYGLNAGSL